jgi:PadR family transcriptional regulator, regulatory protein PadR
VTGQAYRVLLADWHSLGAHASGVLTPQLYICRVEAMNRSRALSPQALAVVAVLAGTEDWRHGYDLMALAGVKSGTLYPLLMRLEGQGLLEARWVESPQPGRPARHVYRLTQPGREWVALLSESLATVRTRSTPLRAAKVRP